MVKTDLDPGTDVLSSWTRVSGFYKLWPGKGSSAETGNGDIFTGHQSQQRGHQQASLCASQDMLLAPVRSVEERKRFLARLSYRFGCVENLFLLPSLSLSLWLRYPTVSDPPIPLLPDPPWGYVMEFVMPCVRHLPARGFWLWTLKCHCERVKGLTWTLSHPGNPVTFPCSKIIPGTCLTPTHPLFSCFLQKLPGNDFCLSKNLEFLTQDFIFSLAWQRRLVW